VVNKDLESCNRLGCDRICSAELGGAVRPAGWLAYARDFLWAPGKREGFLNLVILKYPVLILSIDGFFLFQNLVTRDSMAEAYGKFNAMMTESGLEFPEEPKYLPPAFPFYICHLV
jgi:hypothetical protein